MPATQTDSLIGSLLGGRYEIVARLGRGGTAMVYRATDRRLGRTVAIKVIHSELAGDPEFVKRFDREARAAAILSHPNVVAVFDQGRFDDRPYIVMEFVSGQSLRSIISGSAPLPPARALGYAHEVAKALAAAHEAGLIHRDIKPENVLVTKEGQVKVTDFGLARTVSGPTSTASQGVLLGTMSYIPPEIPQSGAASRASDIYSTGVVIFEMLTGKKPHIGQDLSQVLYKHVNEDIRPPSHALSGQTRWRIPDYVDSLVLACTARDPARRPPNGRVLEEWIAQARRSLDAGLMHDGALVRQFSNGVAAPEETPSMDTTVVVPPVPQNPMGMTPVAPPPTHVPPEGPPAVKLAKAKPAKKRRAQQPMIQPMVQQPLMAPPPAAPPAKPRGGGSKALLIIALVVLLAGGTLVWWAAVGRWTHVPVVAGSTETDARNTLSAQSLTMTTMQDHSETVPVGAVIRTQPTEGTRVKKGSDVTVWISLGPERYPMPTVVGLTQDEATAAILTAHMVVGTVVQSYSETVAKGLVMSASQDPGTSLKPNTPIDLTVSKGREPIPVTSYVGQDGATAKQALEDAGFIVTVTEANSPTVPAGSVISQSPADGNLFKGDTVALEISKGPKMVEVPAVILKTRSEATSTLKTAGFQVEVRYLNPNVPPLGLAYSTDPGAGTMAAEGSTVVLVIV